MPLHVDIDISEHYVLHDVAAFPCTHRKNEVLWEKVLTYFLKVNNTKVIIWLSSSSEKVKVYVWKVNCLLC